MTETIAPPSIRLTRLQRGWLIAHWWALLPSLYLLIFAMAGAATGRAELLNVVTMTIALVSTIIGALMATRVARAGVANVIFVKGTTTVRAIAVAWLALGIVLIWVPIIETLSRLDFGGAGLADGLLGSIGSLSLLAIAGPGYSEYREAMGASARPLP